MASSSSSISALTSEADLTAIHAQSDLQTVHILRHTESDILIGEGRTSGYTITPPTKRKLNSWVWRHGEAITRLCDGQKYWLCRICYKTEGRSLILQKADPTTGARRHLIERHHYNEGGDYIGKQAIPSKRKNVMELVQAQQRVQQTAFNHSHFEGLYTSWALCDNLSLRQATSTSIRALLSYRHPLIEDVLPLSHTTLSLWIKQYMPHCKKEIRDHLSKARSRITLSFDGWTSKSNMDVVAIIAHYIDVNWQRQAVLLSLKPTYGSHSGENLCEGLYQTIQDFNLQDSIAYIIADNASSNDTAISLLSNHITITSKEQRLRCVAHIINLVCKAILFGVDSDCIEDACQDRLQLQQIDESIEQFEASVSDEQRSISAWRRRGPIGKLHNLVHHVRSSPARRHYFESLQKEVNSEEAVYSLITNGGIRWNSTLDMVVRAFRSKDSITGYAQHFQGHKDHPTDDDILSSDDWHDLSELRDLLLPMKETSTMVQSSGIEGALWHSLSALDFLMTKLEGQRQALRYCNNTYLKAAINLGWKKLNKYYTLSDDTTAYRAAIYLNPRFKMAWFERKWSSIHPAWVHDVRRVMEDQYKRYERLYPQPTAEDSLFTLPHKELSEFQAYNFITPTASRLSELERYTGEPVTSEVNIIHWWRDNQSRFPILFHMAMDHLAAPATTAEDEREFSRADDVINNDCPRLLDTTAESRQCIRSWVTAGIVDLTKASLIHFILSQLANQALYRWCESHFRQLWHEQHLKIAYTALLETTFLFRKPLRSKRTKQSSIHFNFSKQTSTTSLFGQQTSIHSACCLFACQPPWFLWILDPHHGCPRSRPFCLST